MKLVFSWIVAGVIFGGMSESLANIWTGCSDVGVGPSPCQVISCFSSDGSQCSATGSTLAKLNFVSDSTSLSHLAVVNSNTNKVGAIIYNNSSCPSGYTKETQTVKTLVNTSLPCCLGINNYNGLENNSVSVCVKKTCAAGTYGNGTTCNPCPSPGTSAAGATVNTSCYITSGSDSTGHYYFNSNCYYKP